jgi:tight adherence protein B
MNKVLIGVGALALVGLFEGAYHALTYFAERRREQMKRRLQSMTENGGRGPSLLRQRRRSSIGFVDALLGEISVVQRLDTLIEQAESGTTVARHLLVSVVAAAAGAVLAILLRKPVLAPMFFGIGACAPTLWLVSLRAKRDRKLSEQLPNALDMMARSLRAGHALPSAFKLVATEMPAPINMEFARAYEEQNLGMSFERTVLQMTSRSPRNRDFKIFAVSVIVQKQTGGNLVEIMEKLAETIRGRYQFYGKLSALAAEGNMSGMVLGALPVITALAFSILNPKYTVKLVVEPMGRMFLVYAVIAWIVGILWLRRMGKVEL